MKFFDRVKRLKSDAKARAEERRARVAADLAILISKAGLRRKDVAQRLEITEAALSIRLNGTANLTLDSIGGICDVAGYDFDVVFRRAGEDVALSFWELEEVMLPTACTPRVADVHVAEVDVVPWIREMQQNVAGILHYAVPSFASADAANDRPVRMTKYESQSTAA